MIGISSRGAGSPPPRTLISSLTVKMSLLKDVNETPLLFSEKRAIKFFICNGFENIAYSIKAFQPTL